MGLFHKNSCSFGVLQNKYKVNKIAIIDFDVHHGNGTRNLYNDETVLYASSHEFPLFPGTGSEQETGVRHF